MLEKDPADATKITVQKAFQVEARLLLHRSLCGEHSVRRTANLFAVSNGTSELKALRRMFDESDEIENRTYCVSVCHKPFHWIPTAAIIGLAKPCIAELTKGVAELNRIDHAAVDEDKLLRRVTYRPRFVVAPLGAYENSLANLVPFVNKPSMHQVGAFKPSCHF